MTWADLKVLGSQPTLTLTLSPSTVSIMASSKPPSPSGTQTDFLASVKEKFRRRTWGAQKISRTIGFEGVLLLHLEREDQPVNEVNQENPSKMKQKDLEGESPKSKTTKGDLQWRPKRKEKQPSMLKQESLTMERDQDPAPAFLLS